MNETLFLAGLGLAVLAFSALIRWSLRVIGYRFADIAPLDTIGRIRCPICWFMAPGTRSS